MGTDASGPGDEDVPGRDAAGPTSKAGRPRGRRVDPPATMKPAAPPTAGHYATQLRETSGAAFLYATMSDLFQQADTTAFKLFRDQLLADAGNPSDPIEIMMIEQIALAHMNVGWLQFRSATAGTADAAKIYGGMATR